MGSPRALTGVLAIYPALSQLAYVPISVPLGAEIGMDPAQVGVTVGVHSLAAALGNLAFGPLFDLVPARRLLPVVVGASALANVALFFAASFPLLLLGRVLTGVTSAAVLLCAYVLVADLAADGGARDRGFARLQSLQSLGAALALGLGALAASLHASLWVFVGLAAYGGAMVVVAVLLLPRGEVLHPEAATAEPVRERLSHMGRLLLDRQMILVMLAAIPLGFVMQGSHFGVSLLSDAHADELPPLARVGLGVLIPLGVFTGSSLVRRLQLRLSRMALYTGLYLVLPLVVGGYAAVSLLGAPLAAQAVTLYATGTVMGALMPLSTAVSVAIQPRLRGTATSAESLARSLGQAAGPALTGTIAALASVGLSAAATAGLCLLGAVAVVLIRRRPRLDRPIDPVPPVAD